MLTFLLMLPLCENIAFFSRVRICHAEKLSAQIGVHLSKLISADGKESRDVRAIEAVMELVREKIIIRHDPLRSPTHCFEPKPERMYGIAGVCGLSD